MVARLTLILFSASLGQSTSYEGQGCSDTSCHGSLTRGDVVHQPVRDEVCDACHESTTEGKHTFRFTIEPSELCVDCHEEIHEDRQFLHGPAATGDCTACHDPHASKHSGLLVAPVSQLCRSCHEEIDDLMEDQPNKHEPAISDCTICHDPHGADNRLNLIAVLPDLCYDCHDDIADFVDDAVVGHEALTTQKSCVNCHNPHASEEPQLLAQNSMTLCLSCHTDPIVSDVDALRGIGRQLRERPNPHGPLRDNDCVTCHTPHGGERFRMLTEAYPAKFYSPFSEDAYALCFSCHDVEAFEDEQTDDLTGFRNGQRNLHYLHVNRSVKGRTCRACHDPHAGVGPMHVAKDVPFGKWKMPLQFDRTETGGSCQSGCHRLYRYDRESPVRNIPPS